MSIMEDEDFDISTAIYNFQMDMIYYNNYIKGLEEYLLYIKMTSKERISIEKEIIRIQFYINAKTRIIIELLN